MPSLSGSTGSTYVSVDSVLATAATATVSNLFVNATVTVAGISFQDIAANYIHANTLAFENLSISEHLYTDAITISNVFSDGFYVFGPAQLAGNATIGNISSNTASLTGMQCRAW